MEEKTTDAYTVIHPRKLPSEIDTDITEEFIKQGFNHFVDKNLLLYTTTMNKSKDLDLEYEEPGTFKKVKDSWMRSGVPVKSGFQRIHEFIYSLSEAANISQEQAAIHMVNHGVMNMDGKGCGSEQEYENIQREAAQFDNKLRSKLDVESEMTEVEPLDEDEIRG